MSHKTAEQIRSELNRVLNAAAEAGLKVVCLAVPCQNIPVGRDGRNLGELTGFWTLVQPDRIGVHSSKTATQITAGLMIEPSSEFSSW